MVKAKRGLRLREERVPFRITTGSSGVAGMGKGVVGTMVIESRFVS